MYRHCEAVNECVTVVPLPYLKGIFFKYAREYTTLRSYIMFPLLCLAVDAVNCTREGGGPEVQAVRLAEAKQHYIEGVYVRPGSTELKKDLYALLEHLEHLYNTCGQLNPLMVRPENDDDDQREERCTKMLCFLLMCASHPEADPDDELGSILRQHYASMPRFPTPECDSDEQLDAIFDRTGRPGARSTYMPGITQMLRKTLAKVRSNEPTDVDFGPENPAKVFRQLIQLAMNYADVWSMHLGTIAEDPDDSEDGGCGEHCPCKAGNAHEESEESEESGNAKNSDHADDQDGSDSDSVNSDDSVFSGNPPVLEMGSDVVLWAWKHMLNDPFSDLTLQEKQLVAELNIKGCIRLFQIFLFPQMLRHDTPKSVHAETYMMMLILAEDMGFFKEMDRSQFQILDLGDFRGCAHAVCPHPFFRPEGTWDQVTDELHAQLRLTGYDGDSNDVPLAPIGERIDPHRLCQPADDVSTNDNCTVCLESLGDVAQKVVQLNACQHFIHLECLDDLINKIYPGSSAVRCPICRAELCEARDYQAVLEE